MSARLVCDGGGRDQVKPTEIRRWRIQFDLGGKRPTVRLGKMVKRQAESFRDRVDELLAIREGAAITPTFREWLKTLGDDMRNKLTRAGLLESQDIKTLAKFLDDYTAGRDDVKMTTRTVYGHTRRNLVEYFKEDRKIDSITQGDAEEWRRYMQREGLSDATVRRRSGLAVQFFQYAVHKKLIEVNPFVGLPCAVRANDERWRFIEVEQINKVIAACPDDEWRLIVALCRFGGLRCPSELLRLRWEDVRWNDGLGMMTVHSPKTEHHEGKATREVPIYGVLRPYLEAVYNARKPDAEYVITRYRLNNLNLRTQFIRIIRKAGLEPWPRVFQNLRSTRESELCDLVGESVACKWIGNSRAVARKHYLGKRHMRDNHLQKAWEEGLAQKAAQPNSAVVSIESQTEDVTTPKSPEKEGVAEIHNPLHHTTSMNQWALQGSNL